MHRALPIGNKVVSRRWEERSQATHYEKLRTARPAIDAAPPYLRNAHGSNGKKDLLAEERYTEIERENRILLEKMSVIIKNPQFRSKTLQKKSLNRGQRRRELVRITVENQALLQRLKQRQSSYSTQQWQQERRRNERILKNICSYPYQLGEEGEGRRRAGSVGSRELLKSEFARRNTGHTLSAADRPRKLVPIASSDIRRIVFKRGLNLGDKYFLVEVSESPNSLSITAFDIENPESYTLELSREEALELMADSRAYDRLLSLLSFENGDLILVDKAGEQRAQGLKQRDKVKGMRKIPSQPQTRTLSTTPSKERGVAAAYGEVAKSFDRKRSSPLTDVSNDGKRPMVLLNVEDHSVADRKKVPKRRERRGFSNGLTIERSAILASEASVVDPSLGPL